MLISQYEGKAKTYAVFENEGYPFLGLAEETGEFLGLMAKNLRGDDLVARFGSEEAVREAFLKEAGDVLWQLSQALRTLGLTLEEAATLNLQKLEDRASRGVLKGSGDNR